MREINHYFIFILMMFTENGATWNLTAFPDASDDMSLVWGKISCRYSWKPIPSVVRYPQFTLSWPSRSSMLLGVHVDNYLCIAGQRRRH